MRARNSSTLCALALALAIAAAPRARAVIIDFNSGTFDWSNPLAWLVSGVPGAKDTARISGGTLSLDNAFTVEGLTLSGGNLTGTGSLTLNGPGSMWSGGTLSGTGTLFLASTASLAIAPASSATLNARQIVNAGSITWSDGQLNTGQGATIVNQAGAFFTLTSDDTLAFNFSGTRTAITNAGTFAKTGGTNTSDIQASLANTGALNVSSGTLQLSGGGTSSGNVTIGTGAKLKIATNAFEFASGTVLNGPGALEIASGTTTLAGTITGSANLIVSGGTATVTGTTTTTGGGTLSSGTINGTGTLTFGNVVSISGGTIADAGTLNLNGGAAITGFVSINGNRTLNLSGNSTWTGGTISTTNATINVGSGATLDTTVNSAISLSGSTPSVFNNQGNVIKSAGTGTTSIDAVFNNTGSLKVLAGNVTLSRGGNSTGTIQIASGSSLFLSSGNFGIADGATLTGPGTLQISGGNTTFAGNQTSSARLGVSGGNLTVNGVTTTSSGLTLSGGTLNTLGTLNIGDPASFSGGTLSGTGSVNLSSGVAVSGSVSILGGVKLNLDDNSTWTGGSVTGGGGSIVTIKPGASLSTTFNGGFYSTTGGGAIVNQGTFTKAGGAGPGETYIDAVFNNTGTLDIQTGTLNLAEGGNLSGTVNISSGASLSLSSQTFVLADSLALTGTGKLLVSGGNATLGGNRTSTVELAVSSGNLSVTGTTSATSLLLSGGTLTIPGTLNIGDPASITGGTITGSGNLNLSSGAAISGGVSFLGGIKLNLDDASTWTSGSITSGGGSVVTIKNGASLTTNFDGSLYNTTGGATLANQGTFTKSGGTGQTYIDVPFNNTGTINVESGTVNLAEGGSLNGTVNITSGATLALSSQTFSLADSLALNGSGKLLISGGNATLAGNRNTAVEFAVSSGNLGIIGNTSAARLSLLGGALTIPGTLSIAAQATLTDGTITGTGTINLNGGAAIKDLNPSGGLNLNLDGNSTWSRGLINVNGNSTITIKPGATLTAGIDVLLINPNGIATLANQGTLVKTTTDSAFFSILFNNTGTVDVQSGTLDFAKGGSSSGTVNIAANAILQLSGSTFTFQEGSQFTGNGTLRTAGPTEFLGNHTLTLNLAQVGGSLSINGNISTSGEGSITAGTLKGVGNLTIGGTLTISGGVLEGAGTTVASGGANLIGGFTLNSGRNLILDGNSTWSAGTIVADTGATLTIKPGANLTNTHNGTVTYSNTRSTVVNQGTITKTTATGTTQFNAIVQNSGKIAVERGTIELAGGGFSSGVVDLAADAILAITGRTFDFQLGSTITGAGLVRVTGGNATLSGNNTGTASFEVDHSGTLTVSGVTETTGKGTFQGGTLNGAGTLSFTDLVSIGGGVSLSGTGRLNANGGAMIDGGLTLSGGQSLALGGNSTWSAGTISGGGSSSTLIVNAGATLTNTHNGNFYYNGTGGRATFQNIGTFTKTTATGITAFDAIFANTGTVDVQTGTLELNAGGFNGGTFNIASGATLAIGGGTFVFNVGTWVYGPGTLRIQGASTVASFGNTVSTAQLAITNGFATFTGNNAFSGASSLSGGTINGVGSLFLHTLFSITGGTFDSTGTLRANGGLALSNSVNLKGGYTLELSATSTWTDGSIYGGGASALTIKPGASLTASGTGSLFNYYPGGATTFRNEGTFTKTTSTAAISLDAPYTNIGTTRIDSGRIDTKQGGSSSGIIEVASGATFAVDGGSFSFDAGSRLLGAGTILISGGTGIFGGTSSATANISMDSGTTTLTGNTVTSGGGTLSAGTVTGSGSLTYGAPLTLSGSVVFSGTGVVLSNGGATISSSFSLKDGQTLTLAGATTFSGGYIYHGGGSILNNSGTLTATTGLNLYHYYGGSKLVFNNSGTFNKTSSGADGDFDAVFNNTGAVNVQAGTLTLYAGGLSSGTVAISSGAKLEVHAGSFFIADGSQVTGAGILALTGGTLTLSGTLGVDTFTQTAGNLAGSHTLTKTINVSYGSWDGAAGATTTLANGATLNLSGSDFTFDKRKIFAASGSKIYWTQGYLRSGNGGSFVNEGEFYDRTTSGHSIKSNSLGGTFTFDNRGLYQREGAYTTYIEVPFLNSGTVNLNQGSLELRGGGTMSATSVVNAASGTTFRFAGDYTLLDGAQLLGGGTYRQDSGTLTIDGNLRASNFTWAGGDWNSSTAGATTTLASGTTLTLNGYSFNFDKRNITIASGAKAVWESGHLEGSNGSILTNNGTFHDRNANGYSAQVDSSFGGTFNFVNNGIYLRDVAGTTYFNVPFNNSGTVELNSGTLYLNAGGTASAAGIFNIASPATLHIQNGYTALDGAQFRGAGKVVQNGGTFDIVGALKADQFLWQGGDWNSATAGATTSIADGTLLRLSSYNLDFNRRSINVDAGATVSWEYGHLRGGNGSVFVNNGTFHDRVQGYEVVGGGQHDGLGGSFSFVNNGTYIRSGAGTTYFTAPFSNTGSISIANLNSSLQLDGGGTMFGTSVVDIVFNATLNITNDYTLVSGARFTGMGFVVHSAGTLTVNGNLNATNFRWTGGDWNSPTAGATTTIGGGPLITTLTIAGGGRFDNRTLNIASNGVVVWQHGYLTSTDSGGIINSGTFIDTQSSGYAIKPTPIIAGTTETPLEADSDGQAVTAPVTGMSFTNNGTYIKQGGGSTYIEVPFTNAGTLTLNGGNIYFNSTFTNTGSITFSSGAQLHASSPLTFSASSPLSGTGTINGSVTAAGQVAPGNSPGKLQITGTLSLLSTSTLLIELGGATQGVDYDYLQVGGTATIAGNLSLTLINGYASIVDSTKTFTVLTSAGLTGAFANIGSGQRLVTTDGLGSFLVTYGSATNSVVLSQFQAIPEPSTYMMLVLGAGLILFLQRRRARR